MSYNLVMPDIRYQDKENINKLGLLFRLQGLKRNPNLLIKLARRILKK